MENVYNRVRETATTTGTGSVTLAGAVAGYHSFNDKVATGTTVRYVIAHQSVPGEFEYGLGTFTAPSTLARTTVVGGSNGASAVNFSAGTKDVFVDVLAEDLMYAPTLVGGTAVGSKITYKSTTGAGTPTGIAHQFVGGTDGATVIATMLNNGNTGIGGTAPLTRLDIAGNVRSTGKATAVLTGSIDPAASTTVTGVDTLFTTELVIGDRITVTGQTRTVTAIASDTSLTVDTAFSDNANDTSPDVLYALHTMKLSSGALAVVVNDLGNVGIGTAAAKQLLDVRGNIVMNVYSAGVAATRQIGLGDTAGGLGGSNHWGGIQFSKNTSNEELLGFYTAPAGDVGVERIAIIGNGRIGLGTNAPASLLDLRAGDLTFSGANGQLFGINRLTELTTIAAATQATTIQIPADAIVLGVSVRVTVKPGGTNATFTVTSTTSGTAFQKGASISSAANTTDPGTKNTPVNYNGVAAQTVTLTFDGTVTDSVGRVRVTIYYMLSTPPTS